MNIQQSDQDSSIVLINKSDYLDKICNTYEISEISKFSVMDKNHPTFIIAIEKKLTNLLKEIKVSETILEIDYKKLKAIVLVVLEL